LNLYRDIRYSLSPRYEIELAFSKLCWLSDYVSPVEVKKAIDNAQALLMQGAQISGAQAQASTPNTASHSAPSQFSQSAPAQTMQLQTPSAPAPIPGAPKMATFSALAGSPIESSRETEATDAQTENPDASFAPPQAQPKTDPFYNGGALPPQNTAAATEADKIKAKVIAAISLEDAFISAGLMQTGEWKIEGNTVSTTIDSAFQKSQLDAKNRDIAECISRFTGQNVSFNITLLETEQNKKPVTIPKQVDILCSVFKGNIVGGV
ncbi:MAG: hypothetical protein K6E69_01200, partial [Treponema sp.]|nr:hypothetical protein [Treponema sp.]